MGGERIIYTIRNIIRHISVVYMVYILLFSVLCFLEVRNGEKEVEMTLLLVMLAVDKGVCWVIVNV